MIEKESECENGFEISDEIEIGTLSLEKATYDVDVIYTVLEPKKITIYSDGYNEVVERYKLQEKIPDSYAWRDIEGTTADAIAHTCFKGEVELRNEPFEVRVCAADGSKFSDGIIVPRKMRNEDVRLSVSSIQVSSDLKLEYYVTVWVDERFAEITNDSTLDLSLLQGHESDETGTSSIEDLPIMTTNSNTYLIKNELMFNVERPFIRIADTDIKAGFSLKNIVLPKLEIESFEVGNNTFTATVSEEGNEALRNVYVFSSKSGDRHSWDSISLSNELLPGSLSITNGIVTSAEPSFYSAVADYYHSGIGTSPFASEPRLQAYPHTPTIFVYQPSIKVEGLTDSQVSNSRGLVDIIEILDPPEAGEHRYVVEVTAEDGTKVVSDTIIFTGDTVQPAPIVFNEAPEVKEDGIDATVKAVIQGQPRKKLRYWIVVKTPLNEFYEEFNDTFDASGYIHVSKRLDSITARYRIDARYLDSKEIVSSPSVPLTSTSELEVSEVTSELTSLSNARLSYTVKGKPNEEVVVGTFVNGVSRTKPATIPSNGVLVESTTVNLSGIQRVQTAAMYKDRSNSIKLSRIVQLPFARTSITLDVTSVETTTDPDIYDIDIHVKGTPRIRFRMAIDDGINTQHTEHEFDESGNYQMKIQANKREVGYQMLVTCFYEDLRGLIQKSVSIEPVVRSDVSLSLDKVDEKYRVYVKYSLNGQKNKLVNVNMLLDGKSVFNFNRKLGDDGTYSSGEYFIRAKDDYPITVEVKYSDGYGNRASSDITIPLVPKPQIQEKVYPFIIRNYEDIYIRDRYINHDEPVEVSIKKFPELEKIWIERSKDMVIREPFNSLYLRLKSGSDLKYAKTPDGIWTKPVSYSLMSQYDM